MPTQQRDWREAAPPPLPLQERSDHQFSLRRLFGLMLVAAVVLGVARLAPLTSILPALPLVVFCLLLVAAPLVALSVPLLTIACNRHAGCCPYGVYMHLGGMLFVLAAIPALVVPDIAVGMLAGGALLMAAGPVLAVGECVAAEMPADCHFVAWLAVANTALIALLVGCNWVLPVP